MNHKFIQILLFSIDELAEKVAALGLNKKEFIKLDIGEVVLDAWMIKPPNFDPDNKYPIVFYVYGEPAELKKRTFAGGRIERMY